MDPDGLHLLQMPEVVMEHILGKLDLPDVLLLRKTCHHLRNLIDDFHLDPKIARCVIIVDTDSINFKLNLGKDYDLYPEGKLLRIKYSQEETPANVQGGCDVEWYRSDEKRGKYIKDLNFIEQFCQDFGFIFGNQTFEFSRNPPSKIQNFCLNFEYYPQDHHLWQPITHPLLSSIQSTLQNRLRPLPVEELYTNVYEKSHVLQVLPHLEAKTLEKISITHRGSNMEAWDLEGFPELEQWKMAKVLWMFEMELVAGVQDFKDFKEIMIKLEKITVEEVMQWKKTILSSSSKLSSGMVRFKICDGEKHFVHLYGPPLIDPDQFGDKRRSWFFNAPDKKMVLHWSFYHSYFRFELLEKAPKNALVI